MRLAGQFGLGIGLGEQVEGEIRARRRCEVGHLAGYRGSLVETLAQYRREITGRKRRADRIGGAAYCLDDVQREAARRRVQQASAGLREALPGDRLGQARGIGGLQWAEGNLGEQSGGPQPDDPARERMIFAEVFLAHGRGHQELGFVGQAQAQRDERHCLLVAPGAETPCASQGPGRRPARARAPMRSDGRC